MVFTCRFCLKSSMSQRFLYRSAMVRAYQSSWLVIITSTLFSSALYTWTILRDTWFIPVLTAFVPFNVIISSLRISWSIVSGNSNSSILSWTLLVFIRVTKTFSAFVLCSPCLPPIWFLYGKQVVPVHNGHGVWQGWYLPPQGSS